MLPRHPPKGKKKKKYQHYTAQQRERVWNYYTDLREKYNYRTALQATYKKFEREVPQKTLENWVRVKKDNFDDGRKRCGRDPKYPKLEADLTEMIK